MKRNRKTKNKRSRVHTEFFFLSGERGGGKKNVCCLLLFFVCVCGENDSTIYVVAACNNCNSINLSLQGGGTSLREGNFQGFPHFVNYDVINL